MRRTPSLETTMGDIARFFQHTEADLDRRAREAAREIVEHRVIHLPGPKDEPIDEPR